MAQSYNSLIAKNTDTQQHGGSRTTLSPKVLVNSNFISFISFEYIINNSKIIIFFLSGVENCSQTTYQHILLI